MTDTIKELIAAGDGLTFHTLQVRKWDGENWPDKRISLSQEDGHAVMISPRYGYLEAEGAANFFALAANARPEIKAMQEENERLREKLGEILTIAADADERIADLARDGLGR